MHINITNSETGGNKGSSAQLVHYLDKENRDPVNKRHECFFNHERRDILPLEARILLDNNNACLGINDAKFFLINISPSRKELKHLEDVFGKEALPEKLKEYAINVMDQYARNFKRPGISSSKDLLWFGKVEYNRYFSPKDQEVKQGIKRVGERKEGNQMHVQVIVSRKDITNKIKLSPLNNSRGSNAEHSKKIGQFDRKAFIAGGERLFDLQFNFDRGLEESFSYKNAMKNGDLNERLQAQQEQINPVLEQEVEEIAAPSKMRGYLDDALESLFGGFSSNYSEDEDMKRRRKRFKGPTR